MEFDAFLSHNSADKAQVRVIAEALTQRQIRVWLDEWAIPPGARWQEALEEGLKQSRSVVVLIGPGGVGRWEDPEIRVALDESLRRSIPVIPVLLPGVSRDQVTDRPFLRQHSWVEFKDGPTDPEALQRLVWGITGRNPHLEPREPAARPVAAELDPTREAIAYLAERSRTTNLTFVLGKNFYDDGSSHCVPARLSHELLASLNLIGADYAHLVPPLDLSAGYYATRWDDAQLESRVANLLMPPEASVPAVYTALARLFVSLRSRPARRVRTPVEQLIVTTNIDTWLERALLRAGIAFSRVVHFRPRRRLLVNQYRNVSISDRGLLRADAGDDGSVTVDVNSSDELDEFIRAHEEQIFDTGDVASDAQPGTALSFGKLQQPIVYKLLGSHDVSSSCAISADQFYDLAWQVSRFNSIPAKIGEIIGNSPVVFLGCGILDSDFRITYYTVLKNAFLMKSHKRYALWASSGCDPRDVAHKMSGASWESFRRAALASYGIELLDESILRFLMLLGGA